MQKNAYKELLDAAPYAYARHQIVRDESGQAIDYIFLEVNATFCAITGLSREQVEGQPVSSVIPTIRQGEYDWVDNFGKIADDGQPVEIEKHVTELGKWYRVTIIPSEGDFITAFFVDITSEMARIDELDRFFSVNLDLLCIADVEGNFIKVNLAWQNVLGYSITELESHKFLDFVHPDDLAATLAAMASLSNQDNVLNFTNRYQSRDGSWRWIEWRSHPHGKLIYAAARDITNRIQIEADLVSEKERSENFIEGTNIGTWEWNIQTGEAEYNERWASMIGYTLAELAPVSIKTWTEAVHPDDARASEKVLDQVFRREIDFYDCECRVRHKDGHWVWVHDQGKVMRWTEDGRPLVMYGTHMDISLRKEAEVAMIQARRLAEEASLAKSQFLANMSHEIRTPLNGVIGFADLMSRTKLDPIQNQYMKNIVQSADSLMDLINDILDFSKIEAGRMELEQETVVLSTLCEDTADFVKLAAHSRDLELVLLIDPALPAKLMLDPVRLRQILVNLLGNAVKFTETGSVTLKAEMVGKESGKVRVRFLVADTGIGISAEQRKKLFTSFSQADPSTTRKYGGTGLGLAISQRLLEKMGSTLVLESTPGQGSCFSFELLAETDWVLPKPIMAKPGTHIILATCQQDTRLVIRGLLAGSEIKLDEVTSCAELLAKLDPANPPQLVLADSRLVAGQGIDCIEEFAQHGQAEILRGALCLLHRASEAPILFSRAQTIGIKRYLVTPPKRSELIELLALAMQGHPQAVVASTQKEPEDATSPVVQHQAVGVMIADDNEINCMLAHSVVKGILPGARIIQVPDGGAAVEAYREHLPDLVLMDVQMPVKDGYAATVEIRAFEETIARRAVIVALTAGTVKGERERCLMSGMDEYITKPFVAGTIENLIQRWMPGIIDRDEGARGKNAEIRKRFDRDGLLARMSGDTEMLQKLLSEVPRVMPGYLTDIKAALATGDETLVRKRAHRIKGAAMGMGFGLLARLAQEIEGMAPWDIQRAHIIGDQMTEELAFLIKMIERESGHTSA